MWDQHNRFTGPCLEDHTNITEIDAGLDLLWRNDIDPGNIVMGLAFYGRSFTMSDPSCYTPAARSQLPACKGIVLPRPVF